MAYSFRDFRELRLINLETLTLPAYFFRDSKSFALSI